MRFRGWKLSLGCWLLLDVKTMTNGSCNVSINAPIKNTAFLDVKDCVEIITPVDSETE